MAVSKEDMLDTISNMSVMEVVDLISAMEEKFGASAAAAVAAAPAEVVWYVLRPGSLRESGLRHLADSRKTVGLLSFLAAKDLESACIRPHARQTSEER